MLPKGNLHTNMDLTNSTLYIRLNIGYKVQFLNLPENYSYRITESSSGIGNNSGWRSPLISYQGGDAKLSGFGDSIFTIEGENDQDDVTVTYTNRSLARINLYKVREGTDASNAGPGQYLAGAEFKLYQWNGETNEEDKIYVEVPLSSSSAYQKRDDSDGDPARITESGEEPVSAVTDQNTILIGEHGVTIYGLVPGGEYKLVEVKIPDGYVAREDTYFKVFYGPKSNSFGMTENWTSLDGVQGDAFKIDNEKNCRPGLWIVNPIGKGLPDTGGRGTTAIYLAGLLLIAGALLGWLRVARKRR
jgi:LPXTG-motif cell wall-anchored protein